jgi:hypothetical protein
MERFDLICKCSHKDSFHIRETIGTRCKFCINGPNSRHWHEFKRDNLKYLEMLSEEKEVADLK